jgi:hypothetical protein
VSGSGGTDGVYVGEEDPVSTLGSNGDIYMQYIFIPSSLISDDDSYIDTGIMPTSKTIIETEIAFTEISVSPAAIIGVKTNQKSNGNSRYVIYFQSGIDGKLVVDKADTFNNASLKSFTTNLTKNDFLGVFHKIKLAAPNLYIDDAVVASNLSAINGTSANRSLYMFAYDDIGTIVYKSNHLAMKYLKIYNSSNTLLRDFVPQKLNGVSSCYDNVTQQVFPNLGSGSFYTSEDGINHFYRQWVKTDGVWNIIP